MLTRLLVLWLLAEKPLYGYEITKALRERAFRFWFPVEPASIYVVLRSLVRHGHARIVRTERAGNRPNRTRVAITPAGRAHYRELLRRAWVELPPLASPLHLALAARSDLDEEEIPALLEERLVRLRQRRASVRELIRAAPDASLAVRAEALVAAEEAWGAALLEREIRESRRTPRKE